MQKQSNCDREENWHWQMSHQITSLQDLLNWLRNKSIHNKIASATLKIFQKWEASRNSWENRFQFAVTPYYLSLVDWQDPTCPILRQLLPTSLEFITSTQEGLDPLAEETNMPLTGLTHRYPDRVLWYLSHKCAMYCRFCMRKRKVSQPSSSMSHKHWEKVFTYITEHKEIKEVILSGGDPLSLSDKNIAYILQRLRAISHLYSIRIHTRMPVTLPMRITANLAKIFKEMYPITIVTHFNCVRELSLQAKQAIRLLRLNGADVLNQAVLLKGINDTVEGQEKLVLALVAAGVKPYYLHRCDEIVGTEHFRVPFTKGMEILEKLRGRNPGIALPRYVVDLPGGGGKVPLEPNYLLNKSALQKSQMQELKASNKGLSENKYVTYTLKNWAGKEFHIHEPCAID